MVKTRSKSPRIQAAEPEPEADEGTQSLPTPEEPVAEPETESEDEFQESASTTDIPDVNANASTESAVLTALPLDRPAKEFFHKLFTDHDVTTLKGPAGRSIKKYGAKCHKCQRKVTSTDSFFGFRAHYQTKHIDVLTPPENLVPKKRFRDADATDIAEMLPMEVPETDPVDGLPWDRSGKEFYQRLFVLHMQGKEKRKSDGRMGTRYSAECKRCGKSLMGLDGFFKFREHYKLRHSDGQVFNGSFAEGGDGLPTMVEGQQSTNSDRPAKEYYNMFYTSHATTKEEEPKPGCRRGCVRYSADCKLCGKKVQGTDSFFGFRAHIKHKHKEVHLQLGYSELSEFVTFPADVIAAPSVGSDSPDITRIRDKSAKVIYEKMFVDQESVKFTGKSGRERKKVSAACSQCSKVILGNSSYHNFKNHAFLCQKEATVAVISSASPTKKKKLKTKNKMEPESGSPSAAVVHRDQQALNRNVALCAAEILIPFDALTNHCFDRLAKDINGHLAWPSVTALTTTHLPELRTFIKNAITRDLLTVAAVAVTVNIWALQPQGYFSVVVHYVDDQWRIQSPVVAFKRFATQPTAKALSESILAALKEFSISDQVVYLDVFDAVAASVGDANAAAENGESSAPEIVQNQFSGVRLGKMIRALKKLLLDSLVVGECKVQMRSVIRTLEVLLEDSVKGSAKVSALLKKISNTPAIWKKASSSMMASTSTWTNHFQKAKLASHFKWDDVPKGKTNVKLTEDDQVVLADFLKVAEAFEELFLKLRQQDTPTVCDLIPFVYGIRQWLRTFAKETTCLTDFAQAVSDLLDSQFEGVDEENIYIISTFVHPTYKLVWCKVSSTEDKKDAVRSLILEKMKEMSPEDGTREAEPQEPPQKRRSALLSFMGEIPAAKATSSHTSATPTEPLSAEAELQEYLEEDDNLIDDNPLMYWKQNKDRFKRLSRLAESVLFIPSGPPKGKLFQNALSADRQLHHFGAHLETLLFCHANSEFSEDFTARRQTV